MLAIGIIVYYRGNYKDASKMVLAFMLIEIVEAGMNFFMLSKFRSSE